MYCSLLDAREKNGMGDCMYIVSMKIYKRR